MSRERWSDHPCEALSALVDGELPAGGRRAAVEAHLRACAVCRGLKEDIEVLGQALAAETPPPVPADLAARIRGRIDAGIPARRGGWWRIPRLIPMPAAAAAAVVVAALVWLAWSPRLHAPGTPPSITSEMAAPKPIPAPAPPAAPSETVRESLETNEPRSIRTGSEVTTPRRDGNAATAPVDTSAGRAEASLPMEAPAKEGPAREGPTRERVAKAADAEKDAGGQDLGRTQGIIATAPAKVDAPAEPPEITATAATTASAPSAMAPGMPAPGEGHLVQAASIGPGVLPALQAAPYLVRLLPDGSMLVRSREYRCVVPIAPDDARLLTSLGERAVADQAPTPDASATMPPGAATGSSGSAPSAEPRPVLLSPEARQRVVHLVRQRYRVVIEERCGPLPR